MLAFHQKPECHLLEVQALDTQLKAMPPCSSQCTYHRLVLTRRQERRSVTPSSRYIVEEGGSREGAWSHGTNPVGLMVA